MVRKNHETVRIRERKLSGGSASLYLDIYVDGVRKHESLGLYLLPPTAPDARTINTRVKSIAENIKSEWIRAIQKGGVRELDWPRKTKMPLITWLKRYESETVGFKKKTLQGRRDLRKKVEEYLREEGLMDLRMDELDEYFCKGFLHFLRTARNGVCKKQKDRLISNGCALHHQAVLNGALNKAVRDGVIPENPLNNIDRSDKFHPDPEEREYLTIDEIKLLIKLPCGNAQVKRAFLFSCFTGLRLSDVRTLNWSKIHEMPDGKSLYISMIMQKTQRAVHIPLSHMALRYLEDKTDNDSPIFQLPASNAIINKHLKEWVKAGNIEKIITFHCSRHTFATMMLTLGADLYTTSKLLGHTNVATTQIYSKIIDRKMVETVNLVDGPFSCFTELDR